MKKQMENSLGNITWSELGKENVHLGKLVTSEIVYDLGLWNGFAQTYLSVHEFNFTLSDIYFSSTANDPKFHKINFLISQTFDFLKV